MSSADKARSWCVFVCSNVVLRPLLLEVAGTGYIITEGGKTHTFLHNTHTGTNRCTLTDLLG